MHEEPLCRVCLAAGRYAATEIADHIIPKAEHGTDDRENYQGLCKPCDVVKTARESKRARLRNVISRVMAAGVTDVDSNFLARYCALEAEVRAAFSAKDGELPSAAYLTNLRQMEELLRIAGPKSRIGGGGRRCQQVVKPLRPHRRPRPVVTSLAALKQAEAATVLIESSAER